MPTLRPLICCAPALLAMAGCTHRANTTILTVQTQPQQTIKGWGIYPCTIQNDRPHSEDYTLWHRPNAARLIWKDLGISFWRCEILPGSYDAVKNDGSLDTRYLDESLVRQIRLADRYGRKPYILSVWSPPALFKNPAVTFGTDPKTKRRAPLRRDREEAYCRYIVSVFDHLSRTRHLRAPMAFSIQNEPSYAAVQWNGTPYTPAQWQRVLKKMRLALNKSGYKSVQLIGPECGSYADSVTFMGGPTLPTLKTDPAFDKALSGFAFHGYTLFSRKSPYMEQLREAALEAKKLKKDVWLSEYSIIAQKRTPLEHALETMQRLGRETAYVPCDYWTWWQGYYPAHPKNEVLLTGRDDKALHISKTFRVLQKLWHSAPAGSIVHLVKSSDADIHGYAAETVQTVAFEHGGRTTLLVINPTEQAKALELQGLKGTIATPFVTDESLDMKPFNSVPVKIGTIQMNLKSRSILVLVAR